MKVVINNEKTKNKPLEYQEGLWSGKKTIIYDGVKLEKEKRNVYIYKKDNVQETVSVKGNQLYGINIFMFGQEIEILRKLLWWEYLLAVLVFAPGLFFGALGGFIGAFLGVCNLFLLRNLQTTVLPRQKIIFCILMIKSVFINSLRFLPDIILLVNCRTSMELLPIRNSFPALVSGSSSIPPL